MSLMKSRKDSVMSKTKIDVEINRLEKKVQMLKRTKEIVSIKNPSFEEQVMILYIENKGVSKVFNLLNQKGFRTEGIRGIKKYTSNDVTKLLEAAVENQAFDLKLRMLVKRMFSRKHMHISWIELLIEITEEIYKECQ